jgi:hypothetical protein
MLTKHTSVEESLRMFHSEALPTYNPSTLEPLTEGELGEVKELRSTLENLIENGCVEACGHRNGRVVWRLTDFGHPCLGQIPTTR